MFVELEQQGDVCFARFSGRLSAGSELEYLGTKGDEIKALSSTKLLARPRVLEVLQLTRLNTILPMAKDVPAGLAYLTGQDKGAAGRA